jgi:hypothetical protein
LTVDEIWKDDRLDRKQDADFLYAFLTGQVAKRQKQGKRASYVLNVDAGWGGGKSFFLERFEQQLILRNHIVASINAWRDDHAEDPYVAIMAAIDKAFAPYVKKQPALKTAWKAAKVNGGRIAMKAVGGAVKVLAKRHLDISADDVFDAGDEPDLLDEVAEVTVEQSIDVGSKEIEKLFDSSLEQMICQFQKTDRAMRSFREKLAAAVDTITKTEKVGPLFILVDELDRCRPTYAIQLLERMKHLFEVEGIVFVFATNSTQLQHSIAGAYGPAFDGFMYLKRFFDNTYSFGRPKAKPYTEELCKLLDGTKLRAPQDKLVDFIDAGRERFDIDLRSLEQIVNLMDAVVTTWPYRSRVELVLLFPLCVSFHRSGQADWNSVDRRVLDQWVFGTYKSDGYGRTFDNRIRVLDAFVGAVSVMHSMQEILDLNGRDLGNDPTQNYIREIFMPEWNGVSVDRDQASVQSQLPQLVRTAGKLQDAERLDGQT